MANGVYTTGLLRLITNGWSAQDPRVLFVDNAGSYTFNKDHDHLDDGISTAELSTTNYVRKALASEAQTTDLTDDEVVLDAADTVWTALGPASGGPTIKAAVVYFHVDGTAANDIPFLYFDDGMPKTVNGEDFTIVWNAEGIVNLLQP